MSGVSGLIEGALWPPVALAVLVVFVEFGADWELGAVGEVGAAGPSLDVLAWQNTDAQKKAAAKKQAHFLFKTSLHVRKAFLHIFKTLLQLRNSLCKPLGFFFQFSLGILRRGGGFLLHHGAHGNGTSSI